MIVVFDSGVLISALHSGGTPLAATAAAVVHGSVAHCVEIDAEVRKALLGRKFKWQLADVEKALHGFAERAILIELSGTLKGVCRDPKDDMILECALLAHAEFIVSGDRDLLVLGRYKGYLHRHAACLPRLGGGSLTNRSEVTYLSSTNLLSGGSTVRLSCPHAA